MALLYAALAYLLGLAVARWWWAVAAVACPWPAWLWLLPLALLPAVAWLDRLEERPHPPLRWPEAAGFVAPRRGPSPALAAGVMLCLLAGFLRYSGQPFARCWTAADLAYHNLPATATFDPQALQITVDGIVDSYPLLVDGRQTFDLDATGLQPSAAFHLLAKSGAAQPMQFVQGRVRITTGAEPRLRYGQQVTAGGRLVEPAVFDGFSYRQYLAGKGIFSVMYRADVQIGKAELRGSPLLRTLYAVRARGEALINQALGEPYAALANGMLLGIEAGIPQQLYDQFNATGTSHVIVISGTNVALIAGVIVAVATRLLGRRRALWPTLAAIAAYALLVGGDASVLRAALMGALFVTAAALQRRSTALVSLAAACMGMTMANPLALWDVGLQLSSMATAGLVLLSPAFAGAIQRLFGSSLGWLRAAGEDVLAVTLAASLATLPLSLYYFGRLSLISLLTNLLIAQVQPLILFGGSAALLAGLAGQQLVAQALFWLPWLALAWTVAVVRWGAELPWATLQISRFGLPQLGLTYAVLGLARWHRPWWAALTHWRSPPAAALPAVTTSRFTPGAAGGSAGPLTPPTAPAAQPSRSQWLVRRLASPGALLAAAFLAAVIWAAALSLPDGRLHVWFLDVGQGDGILIQTPSGRQVLIDGGASAQTLLGQLGAVMPFWDRTLDLVVLTHPDADHMAAQVEGVGRFTIDAAWETAACAANNDSHGWRAAVQAAGAQVQIQSRGGWADLGDGVALWVLGPPAPGFTGEDADNQNSLVAKLVYGDFSVLLTGDAGAAAEQTLLAQGAPVQSTVLKVGHHGSKSSSSAAFIQAVAAPLAAIQVGPNRYGHPDTEVLDRLAGSTILRTDEEGRIEISSDGREMWVETEK